ncbi:MAG: hypothetical protein DHS20C11_07830 [Lysobacteraceae bacterium]|nr:MAG: hypothetical protein DHS20C11_07830 [Xanthomonadaceae bacterium]
MLALIGLLLLGLILWLWYEAVEGLDAARTKAAKLCESMNLQFVDHSVRMTRIRLGRLRGRVVVYRTFKFDYSPDRIERFDGIVELLNRHAVRAELDWKPVNPN